MSVIQSPFFLGALVLFGMASLVRLVISRDPSLKRSYGDDRRDTRSRMPQLPFTDSDGVEVTADRRVLPDRRRHQLLAMQKEVRGNGVPG